MLEMRRSAHMRACTAVGREQGQVRWAVQGEIQGIGKVS